MTASKRGIHRSGSRAALVACAFLGAAVPQPGTAADFYAGKTINFIIGSKPGGGYDIYGRMIARHLARHIPGTPTVVVQNMDGASSIKAASYIYKIAPKNGTVIGAISPGAVIGPLLEGKADGLYDPTKLVYLATANTSTRVCATFATSKIKTFEDALRNETIMGAEAEGGSTRDYAYLHKNTSKAKFRIVSGYPGTPGMMLAMERGEIDGICGIDWSSLRSQKADLIREGKFNILVQAALEPNEELTRMGVPMIWKFIDNEEDRQVAELVIAQQLFGRPYIAPPGTPPEAIAILRTAFEQTMQDPEFVANAAKAHIEISPAGGERVQQGVERIYASPQRIVDKAKEAIKP